MAPINLFEARADANTAEADNSTSFGDPVDPEVPMATAA